MCGGWYNGWREGHKLGAPVRLFVYLVTYPLPINQLYLLILYTIPSDSQLLILSILFVRSLIYLLVYLPVYLPVHLLVHLLVYLITYLCTYLFVYLLVSLLTYLLTCSLTYLLVRLTTCLFTCLFDYLSVRLLTYLFTCLFVYLLTYLSTCSLSLFVCLFVLFTCLSLPLTFTYQSAIPSINQLYDTPYDIMLYSFINQLYLLILYTIPSVSVPSINQLLILSILSVRLFT